MSDTLDMLYGIPAETIQKLTGCGLSTAKRYKAGGAMPEPVKRLLEILLDGDLGKVDKSFKGWKLKRGTIQTPNGDQFEPGEIQAIPFRMQMITSYQRDQRFQRQADFIEERWVINEVAEEA